MNRYKLFNKIVGFSVINQEFFTQLFAEYFYSSSTDIQINITSGIVSEVVYDSEHVVVEALTHLIIEDNHHHEYILKNNDVLYAKCLCFDKIGKYEIEVIGNANTLEAEYMLLQYVFFRYLSINESVIFMHGSAIVYNDSALIFSAPSGTGKSTHSSLWKKFYDIKYINDDKNYIILEDDKLMVYGSPLSGKHNLNSNIKAPLKSIIFLEQNKENSLKKLTKMQAFFPLLSQTQRNTDLGLHQKANVVFDRLLELPLYLLRCKIDKEAVDLVKDALFGEVK